MAKAASVPIRLVDQSAAPEHIARAIELAYQSDCLYFEENQGEIERVRPAVEGEFWPYDDPPVAGARVIYVSPDFQYRIPLESFAPLNRKAN